MASHQHLEHALGVHDAPPNSDPVRVGGSDPLQWVRAAEYPAPSRLPGVSEIHAGSSGARQRRRSSDFTSQTFHRPAVLAGGFDKPANLSPRAFPCCVAVSAGHDGGADQFLNSGVQPVRIPANLHHVAPSCAAVRLGPHQ